MRRHSLRVVLLLLVVAPASCGLGCASADAAPIHRQLVLPSRTTRHQARAAEGANLDGKGFVKLLLKGLDQIQTPASLSGPKGILFGIALAGVKHLASGLAPKEDDEVTARLKEIQRDLQQISAKIDNLQKQVKDAVSELQVLATEKEINDIESAWTDLNLAVNTDAPTGAGKTAFNDRIRTFEEAAGKLTSTSTHLNNALIKRQIGPENKEVQPLLARIRDKMGRGFFTHKSSEQIQEFFRYYEWWQIRLATIYAEYYTLRGNKTTAGDKVTQIEKNLTAQREALPPRQLAPSVFIDTKTKLMWKVKPEFAPPANIVASGFSACSRPVKKFGGIEEWTCEPNVKAANFDGLTGWRMPTADQASGVLTDRAPGEDPVTWLQKPGVMFDYQHVPGWQNLDSLVSLWVRDKFKFEQQTYRGSVLYTRVFAEQLVLKPGKQYRSLNGAVVTSGSDIKPPKFIWEKISHAGCTRGRSCATDERTSGFILWVRPLSEQELPNPTKRAAQYW